MNTIYLITTVICKLQRQYHHGRNDPTHVHNGQQLRIPGLITRTDRKRQHGTGRRRATADASSLLAQEGEEHALVVAGGVPGDGALQWHAVPLLVGLLYQLQVDLSAGSYDPGEIILICAHASKS